MLKIKLKILLVLLCYQSTVYSQTSRKISLKDSLDHAFDLSDYIIEANGFVPVPFIITEPALGGFGGAILPVFIKKRSPYIDSTSKGIKRTPVAPDITGGIAMYTINNSWMIGAFRSGTFKKAGIRYMIGGGYADINMSFYKMFPLIGEKELQFNIQSYPLLLQATKRIGMSKWYAGFKYLFLRSETTYNGRKDLDSLANSFEFTSNVSQLGALVELDNRDNIFTPNSGIKVHVDAIVSDNVLGSDHDFWKFNYYAYFYKKLSEKWIAGLRIDGQQAIGDIPFYLLPFLDMRGLPAARYQGKSDLLSEAELRWDFLRRWSVMLYGGTGKAFDNWKDFGDANWVYSYGTGFRYLLARKFKLRVGIDLAKGPDNWAYYIVFGSSWIK